MALVYEFENLIKIERLYQFYYYNILFSILYVQMNILNSLKILILKGFPCSINSLIRKTKYFRE